MFESQTLKVNGLDAPLFAIVCIRCSGTAGSDNNANRKPGQLHSEGKMELVDAHRDLKYTVAHEMDRSGLWYGW